MPRNLPKKKKSLPKKKKTLNHSKEKLKERNEKGKYTDKEIARARYADSVAKFIVRDRISNELVNTDGKWTAVSF